jgi:hypothetical protein
MDGEVGCASTRARRKSASFGLDACRAGARTQALYLFRCLHCDWYGAFYAADLSGDPDAWKRKTAALPHRIVQWLVSKFR